MDVELLLECLRQQQAAGCTAAADHYLIQVTRCDKLIHIFLFYEVKIVGALNPPVAVAS